MKGNLLLIEDEPELSESMKELLEDEAKEIFVANNGAEALEILASQKIDCVVSDIKMPVMDGLSFIKQARERGHNQPVIFFTGHGSEELREQARELGASELLMKPNFLSLEVTIREHMTRVINH